MKIALLTAGTRGDVQPFVALARGLLEAGDEPFVAVEDPSVRRRASELGEAIRSGDGVGRAIEIIRESRATVHVP